MIDKKKKHFAKQKKHFAICCKNKKNILKTFSKNQKTWRNNDRKKKLLTLRATVLAS